MSMYESTATGLGGGGGLEDGGWGDGLAKVLQELVETGGVAVNIEGTNGGEESGLKVRHIATYFVITNSSSNFAFYSNNIYIYFISNNLMVG